MKQLSQTFLLLVLIAQFSENTGNLSVDLKLDSPFILDSSAELRCHYQWDEDGRRQGRHPYSVKWYKEGVEFYRFVPSEEEPIVTFPLSGVDVEKRLSNASVVHLRRVQWSTGGEFRCEVTADDWETVRSNRAKVEVVAIPRHGPTVTGHLRQHEYSLGDEIDLNCTTNSSDPLADIYWYINGESPISSQIVHYKWHRETTNLMTKTVGLRFRLAYKHIGPDQRIRIKCTAMLMNVFLKSEQVSLGVSKSAAQEKLGAALHSKDADFSSTQLFSSLDSNDEDGTEAEQSKKNEKDEERFRSHGSRFDDSTSFFSTSGVGGLFLSNCWMTILPPLFIIRLLRISESR